MTEINAYMNGYHPCVDDLLEDWKRQIAQAGQYGYYFDYHTVQQIVKEVERLKVENEGLNDEFNLMMNCNSVEDYLIPKLKEAQFDAETAKEFLYQHIQTNKELEKKVEHWKSEYLHMKALYDSLDQRKSEQFFQLRDANQKVDRLEIALKQIDAIFHCEIFQSKFDSKLEEILKQALGTEAMG